MSSPTDPFSHPDSLDDAALDELLSQARWPDVPTQMLERLQAEARPRRVFPTRRILAVAAVVVVASAGAVLWLRPPSAPPARVAIHQPRPGELNAVPDAIERPLPGRAPDRLELAMLDLELRAIEARMAARSHPSGDQPALTPSERIDAALAALASGNDQAAREQLLNINPRTADELLLARVADLEQSEAIRTAAARLVATAGDEEARWRLALLSERYEADADRWKIEPFVVEAVARSLPARALAQAAMAGYGGRQRGLLAAVAMSPDSSAGLALLEAAQAEPILAREAIAQAPRRAPGLASLVDLLGAPQIDRRREAAWLLAASDDPAIWRAVADHLSNPGTRREATLAMLWSADPQAQQSLSRAAAKDPVLQNIAASLVSEGLDALAPQTFINESL